MLTGVVCGSEGQGNMRGAERGKVEGKSAMRH
jgi:hypothetical protein